MRSPRTIRIAVLLGLWAAMLLAAGGCNEAWTTPHRYEQGLVMVLPGVEGVSALNLRICEGLYDGGVRGAIERRPGIK